MPVLGATGDSAFGSVILHMARGSILLTEVEDARFRSALPGLWKSFYAINIKNDKNLLTRCTIFAHRAIRK